MELRKGRIAADHVLGGRHPPSQVVGIPWHWVRRGNGVAIVVVHFRNLGDIALLEEALHVDRMTVISKRVSKWTHSAMQRRGSFFARKHIPLGAAEAEAVGQLPTQGFPESGLLLLRELNQIIIVSLKVFPFFDDVGAVPVVAIVSAITISILVVAATTTASTTTSSTTSLLGAHVRNILGKGEDDVLIEDIPCFYPSR